MPKLSKIPSVLLTQALDDLEKTRRDPRYRSSMADWYYAPAGSPSTKWPCTVCLAGSVVVQSLGSNYISADGEELNWTMIQVADDASSLRALNELRCGEIAGALTELGILLPSNIKVAWPISHTNPRSPPKLNTHIAEMRALAAYLEEHGL